LPSGSSLTSTAEKTIDGYKDDWCRFAADILNVRLDDQQEECLYTIQTSRRISIRSGNARGKDYVAAAASLCFLYLNYPSKVIETAPTGRQVKAIMMAEISRIYQNAVVPLGGEIMAEMIKFSEDPDWYLMAFKAGEKEQEPWSGFHSPHLMVVVTEASGVADEVFTAIEGILQADSKLVLCFNPNRLSGEAYKSIMSPAYKTMRLNCLDAPNVKAKKTIFPGQVDYFWIRNLITEKRWATPINKSAARPEENDFEFEDKWYRPNDLFRVKVLGELPKESEDVLIPLSWINAAIERWKGNHKVTGSPTYGVDVAGEGRDFTVFVHRYRNVVNKIDRYSKQDHMVTAGRIKGLLDLCEGAAANIDTIGEGAGVYSRCREQDLNVVSAKFSKSAKGLKDYSDQRTFANMRAYCYWAIRDALNPEYEENLALPPDDELTEELHEVKWSLRSNGDIIIEPKEDIKKRIGRSPDKGDALALTYFPNYGPQIFI